MAKNAIPDETMGAPPAGAKSPAPESGRKDLASRIAEQTLTRRGMDYAEEVRRLLDAALDVIRQCGTTTRPKVADIVTAAGLSNDAFYRHFTSRDALVAALLEDGTERLASYLEHQMGKEVTPEGQVRRWVEGLLSQARGEIAATTLAVLWNGDSFGASGRHNAGGPLGVLLLAPFRQLGSKDPDMCASLLAHALLGTVTDYLWSGATPSRAEVARYVKFALQVASA